MSTELPAMPEDARFLIVQAFQSPSGKYRAGRAAQLSGIPRRTVHHWAKEGLLVPDFDQDRPKMWSYRDLVYLRLFAWLRSKRQPPASAARHVRRIRSRLTQEPVEPMLVRSDGQVVLLGDERVDELSGQQLLTGLLTHLSAFDLLVPLPASL